MAMTPVVKRTPRAQQALGALIGAQIPTYQITAPRRPWQSRVRRWALRKAARMVWKACRRSWGWRRPLAPVYLAMVTWMAAAISSQVQRGWMTLAAVAAVGAVPLYHRLGGPLGRFSRRRDLKPITQRIWYAAFYAALSMWAAIAAATSAMPPMPGILFAGIALPAWVAWMWHHRTRTTDASGVVGQHSDRIETWATVKPLAGTSLVNVKELENPRRFEAEVDTSGTELLVKDVVAAVPHIAKRFGRPKSNIIADYTLGRVEHLASLTVVEDNPCHEAVTYDESWIPTEQDIAEGCVPFHLFPNGMRGRVRIWLPNAGTVNSLFSGDIRTGKSEGMSTKMIQACFTGRVWPMAADPQGGVSMPTWCGPQGRAKWQASCKDGDLEPIWFQVQGMREAMYARSDAMSRFVWVDKWGDEQVGINCWDPSIMDWPAVGYALDEAHMLMKIPEFAAIIKELLKMMNKTGLYMDLATQYPAIEEFNNDMAIRQSVTAGNGMGYRNTAGTVKEMTLPKHLPSPFDIPTETLTGGHTKGTLVCASQAPRSSLPVYSRSVWVERGKFWADKAMERVPELDAVTRIAFAKYMPLDVLAANGFTAPPKAPEQPRAEAREQIVVAEPQRAKRLTAFQKITKYLQERPSGQAHTGVIAEAIGENLTTVSTALSRAEKAGKAHSVDHGVWALGREPNEQLTIETEVA